MLPHDTWSLVDVLMAQLHGIHAGIDAVRPTDDADIGLRVETTRGVRQRRTAADEDVPLEVAVTISYEHSHGRKYRDMYQLTSQTLMNETTTSPSNTDEAGMQRRLVQALEAIARGVANR